MHITSIVKRSHLILCLTLLASYCVPQLSAQSTVPNGNGSSNQIAVQGAFDQHRTFPETSNGYLFSFVRAPQPGAANIILNSVDTGARTEVTFALDGANSLQIEGVTVSPNQHLLVAGVLTRSDNGAKETFLAAADFSGNIIWRFNLGMYLPQRLCGASDGTVWVLGQDMKKEIAKGNKGDYDLLRAYSGDGQLQHSYLSRKSFTLSVEGILNLGHGSPALLSCGQQSVGVYLGIASSPTWFEVQLTSGAVQQWSVTHRQYAEISALSLLGKGTVFASFISTRNNKSAGLYTLVPGAGNSARWAPVGGENVRQVARLVGGNGATLFYVQKPIPAADGPVLQVKAEDLSLSNRPEVPAPTKKLQLPPAEAQQVIPPEKLGKLVEMTAKAVSDAKQFCKSLKCQNIAKDLESAIGDWKRRDASNTRTRDHDTQTQKVILQNIQDLQDAIKEDNPDVLTLLRQDGRCAANSACAAAGKSWELSDKPFLMLTDAHDTCMSNCDRLGLYFGAICAAYFAVSPIAGAICELVVAQQYAKCILNCPPPTPGCS